jgi:hypothetical protein
VDAIKAINKMKGATAMDGSLSHSPEVVRDKPSSSSEQTLGEHSSRSSGGLWTPKATQ